HAAQRDKQKPAVVTEKSIPMLLVAELFRRERKDFEGFVKLYRKLFTSAHNYTSYHFPLSARPGRYDIIHEWFADGRRLLSTTAESDHVFVEDLRLRKFIRKGSRSIAQIENPSPEPTPACLYEMPPIPSQEARFRMSRLVLPACSVTEIPLESTTGF